MSDFAAFVLRELPPPPLRVLEVGCGEEGGLVETLVGAGYDALGLDPYAPPGPRFRRGELLEVDESWDAVVAGRVLHHVEPFEESLDHLAAVGPLLLVDEFASDLIDERAQRWYEVEHARLRATGVEPAGPADLDAWRGRHSRLHPHSLLLEGLRRRYEEQAFERVPYFHRWLGGSEAAERVAIESGTIPAIGWRWAGVRRGCR